MTKFITLKTFGLEKITQRLNNAIPTELKKELRETVKRQAEHIQSVATAVAPRDTGLLASQIEKRFSRGGLTARVGIWDKGDKKTDRGYIARFLEFGTRDHSARRGANLKVSKRRYKSGVIRGIAATHWFLGMSAQYRNQIKEAFGRALRDALARGAK